jgi:hypothetical protein
MATRVGKIVTGNDRTVAVVWTGLTNATSDKGAGVSMAQAAFKSAQITGTFGAGGSVTLEGSMDGGLTWGALKNLSDADLTITDSKVYNIPSVALLIRPNVTAGDGTTSLTVTVAGLLVS